MFCEHCRRRSNGPPPLAVTYPGWGSPAWFWDGAAVDPVGKRCKLCSWACRIAGYAVDLKTQTA
eukprot:11196532-Lingulodinium_polyedra.AAC.1